MAEGDSDPRAQGDSEGPTARLPAPGLSTASDDQGHPASAGNRPDFHPGTGAAAGRHRGLSEMDGRALCYPAFALVARLRKGHRDEVNPAGPDRAFSAGPPMRVLQGRAGEAAAKRSVGRPSWAVEWDV